MAGILAGLFGIGGGAILVPAFYQLLGVLEVDEAIRMHLSVGTSLAIIVPTSLRSFVGHRAKGVVDMEVLKSFLIVVPVGVIMAAIVTAFVSGSVLRIIFTVFSLVIAVKLLFAKEDWRIASKLPTGMARMFAGWVIGFFSTFMGIGGGVFNNTFMTLYGRPIHQAVATSSGVGVLISIPWRPWLYLGGLGSAGVTAIFNRLCQSVDDGDRYPGDLAGCANWRHGGPPVKQAILGVRVRDFSSDRGCAVWRKSCSDDRQSQSVRYSRSPRNSNAVRELRKFIPSRLCSSAPG